LVLFCFVCLICLTETTVAAVEVTFVGVDDTVRAAHGFVLLGTEARTGTALPAGPKSTCTR
jgi:hypothetical protein